MDQSLTGMGGDMAGDMAGAMLAILLVVGFLVLVFVAIQGMSLKWSVYLVGAGPIGFLYGTLVAFVMSLAGCAAALTVMFAFEVQHQGILAAYSMTAAVIVLAMMVKCNPLEAILAYLCHAVISTFLGGSVAVAAVVMLMIAVQSKVITLPENPPAMMGQMQSRWTAESPRPTTATPASAFGTSVQSNPFGN